MSISEQRSFSQTSVVSQPRQQPERARSPLPLPTGSQPPQSPALHSFLYYNSSLQENQSLDHAASELVNTNGDPERPSLVGQRNFAGGNAMNLNTTTAASSSKPSSRSTSRPNSRPPSRSETTTSKRREFQQAANAGRSSTAANGTAHARVGKRPHPVAGVKFHGDDDAAADMSGEELLALRSSTAPSAWLPESGGAAGVGAFAPQHQFGSGMKRSANAASAPHSRARAMRSRGAGAGGGRQLNASARSASLNGTLSGTTQTQQLEFDDLDGTTFTTDNEQEVGSLSAGAGGTTRTNGSLLKKAFEQGINLYARPPVLAAGDEARVHAGSRDRVESRVYEDPLQTPARVPVEVRLDVRRSRLPGGQRAAGQPPGVDVPVQAAARGEPGGRCAIKGEQAGVYDETQRKPARKAAGARKREPGKRKNTIPADAAASRGEFQEGVVRAVVPAGGWKRHAEREAHQRHSDARNDEDQSGDSRGHPDMEDLNRADLQVELFGKIEIPPQV
eukprot:CAMPEP_0178992264 /NCGR_PEP_ID=MMETSP0795-20121207/6010_1 /TAXON_ID=88552 /ORGANISM="Amoebophrya sp., Strain Ameob2" /LENGTH=504 /DNA_ID=CAMNT_0020684111 /DNA_START=279 /DNA_END=1793 /DNA_ORIENTATION=+